MPTVYFSPVGNSPAIDANGEPYSSGELYTYDAGSTTPRTTYTSSAGTVAQANPIVLNTRGMPSSPIWLPTGQTKFLLKNEDGDTIWTIDNVSEINDQTTVADQWTASGLTPTYIAATQFSVPGDHTSTFEVGRRLRATVNAGTVYSRISVSSFGGGITTVTVVNDSTTLDSGMSAVSYGILTATNQSIPPIKGTVTNDSAPTGYIGEFQTASLVSGSATSLVTSTPKTIISVSLTAGDWDVEGLIGFIPAATTNITALVQSISLVTNTLGAEGTFLNESFATTGIVTGNVQTRYGTPIVRVSIGSTTTVYLVASQAFTVDTMTGFGTITARRVR